MLARREAEEGLIVHALRVAPPSWPLRWSTPMNAVGHFYENACENALSESANGTSKAISH